MSRQYLCVWSTEGDQRHVALDLTPTRFLGRKQGRASVLIPLSGDGDLPSLADVGTIVFLVPSNTAELLASLANDVTAEISRRVCLSYGHASVVLLLQDRKQWQAVEAEVRQSVRGLEVWDIADGPEAVIRATEFERPSDDLAGVQVIDIQAEGLSFEASAQVRQFNANLSVLARTVRHYAPTIWPLIVSLQTRVLEIVKQLQDLDTDSSVRQAVVLESVLVETNAVTTLYCSQLGSGTLPLGRSRFPVAEYSLLGIGVPLQCAWRFYHHLSEVFAASNHPGRLKKNLPVMGAIEWRKTASARRDFTDWDASRRVLEAIEPDADLSPRLHIPHFSSRWGYHESLHSISLSWQSITASGAKEWNLLTLTHEFMHSQVRAMFAHILDPEDTPRLAEAIVDRYNKRDLGNCALHSLQTAYAEALVIARTMATVSRELAPGNDEFDAPIPDIISVDYFRETFRSHSELLHEIAVHVLDFRYVYASREAEYIDSVWSSWSLVPSVVDRVDYYVLRTMCGLSANNWDDDYFDKFDSVRTVLLAHLIRMRDSRSLHPRPAIDAAIAILEDEAECERIALQFVGLQYVVQLTLHFLFDSRIGNDLLRDDVASSNGDAFTYGIDTGSYVGLTPRSPVGFLLDRFSTYSDQAGGSRTEFEGLWQMLHLT